MRGLFFKIFIIFWIAQSLIFVISTALILNRRFPGPAPFLAPAYNALRGEASHAIADYESQGCAGMLAHARERKATIAIADTDGKLLCKSDAFPAQQATRLEAEIGGVQAGDDYIWTVRATAGEGKSYLYMLSLPRMRERRTWYGDMWRFAFPQLPVAIAVGGTATFVLVLIFTRPVARLRRAARQLAQGNLRARVKGAEGRPGILKDDEFHALMVDFNHMAERLEGLVDAQKLLLRDVSHELRSPLARLSVALELAREDADATMTTHLDRIERETGRLNQLIGQLLTLSSMEAVEKLERFEPVSMKALLEELIPDAAYEAQQREATVKLDADCDCAVSGHRELLYRAMENVVRNAIRYTEAGTEVEIRLHGPTNGAGRAAVVEVSDRGPGIPEKERARIFRPFYRVDQARSSHTGGFGVGLAIAERAVKLHHGEMRVKNREGGGITFEIRLPLEQETVVSGQ
jgi:two-component system sensor histidine kinase CpxA